MDIVCSGVRWQTYQESDAKFKKILTCIGKKFDSFKFLPRFVKVEPTIGCHRLGCFKWFRCFKCCRKIVWSPPLQWRNFLVCLIMPVFQLLNDLFRNLLATVLGSPMLFDFAWSQRSFAFGTSNLCFITRSVPIDDSGFAPFSLGTHFIRFEAELSQFAFQVTELSSN